MILLNCKDGQHLPTKTPVARAISQITRRNKEHVLNAKNTARSHDPAWGKPLLHQRPWLISYRATEKAALA